MKKWINFLSAVLVFLSAINIQLGLEDGDKFRVAVYIFVTICELVVIVLNTKDE